jgi:hypothetical protein
MSPPKTRISILEYRVNAHGAEILRRFVGSRESQVSMPASDEKELWNISSARNALFCGHAKPSQK